MSEKSLREFADEIRALIDDGKASEAIPRAQYLLQHYPRYLYGYQLLAEAALAQGSIQDAIEIFQRVLSVDPENVIAHQGLAVAYTEQDDLNEALWYMMRAFEGEPRTRETRQQLRYLYELRDGRAPGRLHLNRAALARIYMREGIYERAINELDREITTDTDRVDLMVALAEAYWFANRRHEAVQSARQVLLELPFSLKANLILGEFYAQEGDYETAEQHWGITQHMDPDNEMAISLFGESRYLTSSKATIPSFEEAWSQSASLGTTEAHQMPSWLADLSLFASVTPQEEEMDWDAIIAHESDWRTRLQADTRTALENFVPDWRVDLRRATQLELPVIPAEVSPTAKAEAQARQESTRALSSLVEEESTPQEVLPMPTSVPPVEEQMPTSVPPVEEQIPVKEEAWQEPLYQATQDELDVTLESTETQPPSEGLSLPTPPVLVKSEKEWQEPLYEATQSTLAAIPETTVIQTPSQAPSVPAVPPIATRETTWQQQLYEATQRELEAIPEPRLSEPTLSEPRLSEPTLPETPSIPTLPTVVATQETWQDALYEATQNELETRHVQEASLAKWQHALYDDTQNALTEREHSLSVEEPEPPTWQTELRLSTDDVLANEKTAADAISYVATSSPEVIIERQEETPSLRPQKPNLGRRWRSQLRVDTELWLAQQRRAQLSQAPRVKEEIPSPPVVAPTEHVEAVEQIEAVEPVEAVAAIEPIAPLVAESVPERQEAETPPPVHKPVRSPFSDQRWRNTLRIETEIWLQDMERLTPSASAVAHPPAVVEREELIEAQQEPAQAEPAQAETTTEEWLTTLHEATQEHLEEPKAVEAMWVARLREATAEADAALQAATTPWAATMRQETERKLLNLEAGSTPWAIMLRHQTFGHLESLSATQTPWAQALRHASQNELVWSNGMRSGWVSTLKEETITLVAAPPAPPTPPTPPPPPLVTYGSDGTGDDQEEPLFAEPPTDSDLSLESEFVFPLAIEEEAPEPTEIIVSVPPTEEEPEEPKEPDVFFVEETPAASASDIDATVKMPLPSEPESREETPLPAEEPRFPEPEPEPIILDEWQKAQQAWQTGNEQDALSIYQAFFKEETSDELLKEALFTWTTTDKAPALVYQLLGDLYRRTGRLRDAVECYREAINRM